MPEETSHEFDNFRLNPLRRSLLQNEESKALTPTAFDLLLVFVQNQGQTLSKTELIKRVWADTVVTDNNFNVTLNAVRRALGESAKQPRYIFKLPSGYRFIADVREVKVSRTEEKAPPKQRGQDANISGRSNRNVLSLHVLTSGAFYGALFAVSVFLEVAYEFDRFSGIAWKIAPLTFASMMISSVAGLTVDRKLTSKNPALGLTVSIAIFLVAATILIVVLSEFLPPLPITQSTLQSYPAQAAYLKDTSYFLALALCFLIVPFHFVVSLEREIEKGRANRVLGLLTGNRMTTAPRGTIYLRFWALSSLLVVFAAFSLAMTARLLDHLTPGKYMNLFSQLVYVRGILYFGLGIECLIWYYLALERLKRAAMMASDESLK
ncbi:MAG TPA: winged helix-turn-helix domain-containing protein [Pyrinomonadaceae bacterium]|nr:winged helix-turn-helix domain-containing protein [Pyrinomonadaceae bacterium]